MSENPTPRNGPKMTATPSMTMPRRSFSAATQRWPCRRAIIQRAKQARPDRQRMKLAENGSALTTLGNSAAGTSAS
jgi:hypothetical protein